MAADAPGRRPSTADTLYAVLAVGAAVLGWVDGPRTPLVAAGLAVALLPWAVMLTGRTLPRTAVAALVVVGVAVLLVVTGPGGAVFLSTVTASWLASRIDGVRAVVLVTVVAAALPSLGLVRASPGWDVGAVYFGFGNVFAVVAGVLLRRSERLSADLRLAHARLADAAARAERQRIARDVHDLVAHSLTVVVLHVGGARRVLRSDPQVAEDALRDAERVCRESLDGIRGVVGLLREDGSGSATPSLDLVELADGYREAGLPVSLTVAGRLDDVPLVLRVTLYRVVAEALANAARHGGPHGPVTVEVDVDGAGGGAGVRATVTNDIPTRGVTGGENGDRGGGRGLDMATSAMADPGAFGGHGLTGLREQVNAVGGELSSGPDPARRGTWRVECTLPVATRAARPVAGVGGQA